MVKINEDGTYTLTKDEIYSLVSSMMKGEKDKFLLEIKQLPIGKQLNCPMCESNVGKYKRILNQGQVYFLYELYEAYKSTKQLWHRFDDIQTTVKQSWSCKVTDYSKLKDWDLITPKSESKEDGNSSGYFRITRKGAKFLDGKITLPKYLLQTSQGYTIEESSERVTINDYFEKFNLNKLLKG